MRPKQWRDASAVHSRTLPSDVRCVHSNYNHAHKHADHNHHSNYLHHSYLYGDFYADLDAYIITDYVANNKRNNYTLFHRHYDKDNITNQLRHQLCHHKCNLHADDYPHDHHVCNINTFDNANHHHPDHDPYNRPVLPDCRHCVCH